MGPRRARARRDSHQVVIPESPLLTKCDRSSEASFAQLAGQLELDRLDRVLVDAQNRIGAIAMPGLRANSGNSTGDHSMPLAKIHIVEGRYDEARIAKMSGAIQAALMNTLRVPPEDFYQLIFEFPKQRFLHTPSFVGMHYTDDLIILDLTFIEGRSKETRLALLKDVNTRVAAAAGVSPDDLMITLYEAPGENFSFGRGEAQRANAIRA
jgi:phenylpyruvate tautomerase PptA (4-oxalocrotonate tautomerase family)